MLCKMNERLEQIRKLLGELEAEMKTGAPAGDRDFSALELPLIIQQIVDDLQPQLSALRCGVLLVPLPPFHRQ